MATLEQNVKFIYKSIQAQDRKKECICEEWRSFNAFFDWMIKNGYTNSNPDYQYSIQRKDKNKNFSPENCFLRVFGRRKEDYNKEGDFTKEEKDEIIKRYYTQELTQRQLAEEYGVCQGTITKILKSSNLKRSDFIKIENLPGEIWKDIPKLEGKYAVSNMGRVKTYNYRGAHYEKLLQFNYHFGYPEVNLPVIKNIKIHRLVAQVFIPNPNNYPFVNHKNENREDARVENLEWCDIKYNNNYSNGLSITAFNPVTNETIHFQSIQSTKEKGFNPSNVLKCLKWVRKTHNGFEFNYDATEHNERIKEKRKEFSKYNKPHTFKYENDIIYQFDDEGNLIGEWNGIQEASNNTGINKGTITQCLEGYFTKGGGYYFKLDKNFTVIKAPKRFKSFKDIVRINLSNNEVNLYHGTGEINDENIKIGSVYKCLSRQQLFYANSMWFYLDEGKDVIEVQSKGIKIIIDKKKFLDKIKEHN